MPSRPSKRLERALTALQAGLDAQEAPWMCIGGLAVIAHGVKRHTHDVDVAVRGDGTDPSRLARLLAKHGFIARIERAVEFARANLVLLLRHAPTAVDIDVSFSWLAFEHDALADPARIKYGAVRIKVARPEALVVYKLLASRPVDLQDVESLLLLHHETIDEARVRRTLTRISADGTAPNPIPIFDAILRSLPREPVRRRGKPPRRRGRRRR